MKVHGPICRSGLTETSLSAFSSDARRRGCNRFGDAQRDRNAGLELGLDIYGHSDDWMSVVRRKQTSVRLH